MLSNRKNTSVMFLLVCTGIGCTDFDMVPVLQLCSHKDFSVKLK